MSKDNELMSPSQVSHDMMYSTCKQVIGWQRGQPEPVDGGRDGGGGEWMMAYK